MHRVIKIPLDPKSMATYIKKAGGAAAEPAAEPAAEITEEEAAAMIEKQPKQVLK